MKIIDDVCAAAARLSERRHGALVVLERETTLHRIHRHGCQPGSEVSPQLLLTISGQTELHDGAAIVRAGKMRRRVVFSPLSSGTT